MKRNRFAASVIGVWCLLIATNVSFAAQSCEELYVYRDGQLYQDFEVVTNKYQLAIDRLNDLEALVKDLKRDTTFRLGLLGPSFDATADSTRVLGELASTLKIGAETIEGIIGALLPAVGATVHAAKLAASDVYQELVGGRAAANIAQNGLKGAFWELAAYLHPVGVAAKTVRDVAVDIQMVVKNQKFHPELKDTVKDRLDAFEREIIESKKKVEENKDAIDEINAIREGIDLYCKTASLDALMMGTWDIQTDYNFPQQTIHCVGSIDIQQRLGPNHYSGIVINHCRRQAKPGWAFDSNNPNQSLEFSTRSKVNVTVNGDTAVFTDAESTPGTRDTCASGSASYYTISGREMFASQPSCDGTGTFTSTAVKM